MSDRTQWPHKKSLKKMIKGVEINFGFAFDLVHGSCYMVRAWDWDKITFGHGFSKNKFTAVRNAIKDLTKQ